jgi:hypothetical protein
MQSFLKWDLFPKGMLWTITHFTSMDVEDERGLVSFSKDLY